MFKCGWLAGGINISEDPKKQVMPCCHVDKKNSAINDKIYNGIDLINGHTLTEMRKSALEGIPHPLCQVCVQQEKLGIITPRLRSIETFSNKGIIKETLVPEDIESLYLKLSNLCNFKCVMCNAGSSHLISKEKGYKKPLIEIETQFEEQLLDLLSQMSNLKIIQITGGEPLLHKQKNLKILERLPRTVKVEYRTNGSVFDNTVTSALKKFDKVELIVSLDGIGDVLHYQRPNSNCELILENLAAYKEKTNFSITNTQTLTCFNLHQLPKFIESTRHLFNFMVFTPIRFPIEQRINLIKIQKLESIIYSLKSIQNDPGDLKNFILDVSNNYCNEPDDWIVKKFWKTVEYMKMHRDVDLKKLIPEMYEYYRR